MTMIGTKTASPKSWRLDSGGGRRGDAPGKPFVRDEGKAGLKLLAKSQASLDESERMLSRQTVLLEELRAGGSLTTEAEKSVARLEAALLAQRSAHDGLLAKASAGTDATRRDP